jgi:hypothetical protein
MKRASASAATKETKGRSSGQISFTKITKTASPKKQQQFLTQRKYFSNLKNKLTYILCNFLVQTLQCKKKILIFAHENIKKPPSKVAHNS